MKRIQLKLNTGEFVVPVGIGGGQSSVVAITDIFPKNAKIHITSELLTPNAANNTISPLTTSKNKVGDLDLRNVMMKFESDSINFEDAIVIAYQGNTSLLKPKKGFNIDTADKHRFPHWIEMDSFHLKGYYSDWMHARDLCANRLLEQVYLSRPAAQRRPYMFANDFTTNFANRADCNVYCHVDGFPVELYINNVYWGIYSVNIKKNRDNYLLSKNNTNHIQIEAANDTDYTVANFANGGGGWANVEIRNPKADSGNTSFDEGVEPNAGEVKTAWQSFISKINAITGSTTRANLEAFINVPDWIDGIILSWFLNHTDNWCKNTLYTTWDSVHWSPLLYDMDNTWGIVSIDGDTAKPYNYNTFQHPDLPSGKTYTRCPWMVTLETILAQDIRNRYAELRNLGIFSVENVVRIFENWSNSTGYNNYKRDVARWTYPSNGGSAANFYDGIPRVAQWVSGRLEYLDEKYGYVE